MARKTYTTEQIIGILREVEVRLAKRVGIASYANIVVNRWTQLVRGINCPSGPYVWAIQGQRPPCPIRY